MKRKALLCLVILCVAITGSLQAKKKSKQKKVDFKLVEAYSQRIIPGMRPSPQHPAPPPVIHFIVVWQSALHPDAFFWHGDTGLLKCNMVRVHKMTDKGLIIRTGKDYRSEGVAADKIIKGDTLDVTPIPNTRAIVADGVPVVQGVKNTLFAQTTGNHGSDVTSVTVNTIVKKRDIAMP